MINDSLGVPVTTFSCGTQLVGLARSSGFWGLETRLEPLAALWVFRGLGVTGAGGAAWTEIF